MSSENKHRPFMLSWLFVVALLALSTVLAVLQYRWIGEVSRADRERLHASLQAGLARLSMDFNSEIGAAASAIFRPSFEETQAKPEEREKEYAARFLRWRETSLHPRLIRTIGIAVPGRDAPSLRLFEPGSNEFHDAEWPTTWNHMRNRMAARLSPGPERDQLRSGRAQADEDPAVIEVPRFGRMAPDGIQRAAEWMIVELDLDYVRSVYIPDLIQRHLGANGSMDYQAEIVARNGPGTVVYQSDPQAPSLVGKADAAVGLFEMQWRGRGFGGPGGGPGGPGMPRGPERGPPREPGRMDRFTGNGPPEFPNFNRGRWELLVRHHEGSLEAVVDRARTRNLAVTGGILLLMMAAIGAWVRFTGRAQRLAELQMDFIAGVSHELRTPLTVITTASHNLQGPMSANPERVQRYGQLIQEEGLKLKAIVEQVLSFASAKAGRLIGERGPLSVEDMIEEVVKANRGVVEGAHCTVEQTIDQNLPPIIGDRSALKQALENLLINAAKYGREGGWIGISARLQKDRGAPGVEIRVSDRGPGIPTDEVGQVFDPFYRGKRAIADQIHGTGLGLSLTKRIIEAHRGTISVSSKPGQGTEFQVRIPVEAPAV